MPLGKKYYTHHLLIVACGLNPHEREREREVGGALYFFPLGSHVRRESKQEQALFKRSVAGFGRVLII